MKTDDEEKVAAMMVATRVVSSLFRNADERARSRLIADLADEIEAGIENTIIEWLRENERGVRRGLLTGRLD